MKNSTFLLAAAIVMQMFFANCSGSSSKKNIEKDDIVGTWQYQEIVNYDNTEKTDEVTQAIEDAKENDILLLVNFDKNGDYKKKAVYDGDEIIVNSGTWDYNESDKTLTIEIDYTFDGENEIHEKETRTAEILKMDDEKMVILSETDGVKYKTTFIKQ